MDRLPRIAITAGEPAGIGIDLCVMLASQPLPCRLVVIADRQVLASRAHALNLPLQMHAYDAADWTPHTGQHQLTILHQPCAAPVIAGRLDARNSTYVLHTLERAIDGCMQDEFDAMVTAPVHKGVINDAGIAFTGHTEFLAERTGTQQVVMMLVGGNLRVALATTHLPLVEVSQAITRNSLETTIRILQHDLLHTFGIGNPRILVTGLNPHAGEGGHLGTEEITTIIPVLEKLRQEGMQLAGPLPADTLFTQHNLAQGDCVLAMYHDQGLPVLKHASFGSGVNVTLGLPMIRTSVDHGTALDLAGKGNIEIGSLLSAIELAITLAGNRKQPL
ncbi:4-hydroxythreonine-4-phosphate dehydrogenase PdxA [Methylobacillus arboreus]|uniref:4-hydroxythreonine-4-phosphate dehydrogenase PdxA n=1 Tax=Methylobacillus arboreus TaxID=755170 RepID=UPI001E3F7EB3|nr:4-hydroxythreonine-4-phosphate dehydrogenase PdxA [Methylobacillus arboreus]MCB5190359.1 4-hydroxythreonine-4-phosphate dehydrogenase PdxA [Methylobacillus arboreus]